MASIKDWILGIIIAVVFAMFCAYGTNLIYKAPDYSRYCNVNLPYNDNRTFCEQNNGTWIPQNIECIKAPCPQGYCDFYQKCQPEFDNANKAYSKNLFVISIVFSLAVIVIATFLISISSVSAGLMFGSLIYLIYGTARYWGYMDDWLRFIILGAALAILIYIGYRLSGKK